MTVLVNAICPHFLCTVRKSSERKKNQEAVKLATSDEKLPL